MCIKIFLLKIEIANSDEIMKYSMKSLEPATRLKFAHVISVRPMDLESAI